MTKPTLAGMHDLRLAVELSQRMGLQTGVVLNKADLSHSCARDIRAFCLERDLKLLLEIPFSKQWIQSLAQCRIPAHDSPELFDTRTFKELIELIRAL